MEADKELWYLEDQWKEDYKFNEEDKSLDNEDIFVIEEEQEEELNIGGKWGDIFEEED